MPYGNSIVPFAALTSRISFLEHFLPKLYGVAVQTTSIPATSHFIQVLDVAVGIARSRRQKKQRMECNGNLSSLDFRVLESIVDDDAAVGRIVFFVTDDGA